MKKYKLGDICEIVSGSTPKTNITEFWDGDVKWITPAELDENTYIITDSVRKITNLAMQKTGLTAFPAGTVILSSRAPIGKVAIAGCKMCCNQGFKNFICSEIVNNKYLYWFLKHNTAYLNSLGRGATFKEISKSIVSSIEIDLPSLEEQKRVVDNIEKISTIITLRKKEISILDDLIKARFVEMFGLVRNNVYGYKIKMLQDVCEPIKDGTHQTPTYVNDAQHGFKFLSSKDVTSGKINWSKIKYIPSDLHEELYAKIKPKRGDILLAKNGTTGVAAVVETDEIFDIYVSLALLRPIDMNSIYLWAAVNSADTKHQFDSSLKGIGVPNLHLGDIKKTKIIVPPLELQSQFADFVIQVDKSKLLSGCRLFHSWAPENRDQPKHVGVPQRKTKVLRGGRRQQ